MRRIPIVRRVVLFFVLVILIYRVAYRDRSPELKTEVNPLGTFQRAPRKPSGPAIPRPNFKPGVPKPPGSTYSKILVIASRKEEDVSWLDKELPELQKAVYITDDPEAPYHPPKNKGHEAMMYFTYIIDHYEHLPDIMMFMHHHRFAWHNEEFFETDALELIRRLSSEHVVRQGYFNMRCYWLPGCPDWMHPSTVTKEDDQKREEALIAQAWEQIFPQYKVPDVLAQPCCAQFAVSRERVQSIPKSQFIHYRDWLINTELDDYNSGRVWEYFWQVVFTDNTVHCPQQHVCYCDGYGLCFGDYDKADAFFGLNFLLKENQEELRKWREQVQAIEDAKKANDLTAWTKLKPPQPGRDVELEDEIGKKTLKMVEMKYRALEHGENPKNRAFEVGRPWKEGDGF